MKASDFVFSVLVSGGVAAGVTYGMHHYGIGIPTNSAAPPAIVEVPSVIGLRPDQARGLLESRGLLLLLDQEQEDTRVEPGKICEQTPLEGSRTQRGQAVRAIIARAPETVSVPTVVGRSASKAKELLIQAGFAPGNVHYKANENRDEGVVLEQTPAGGQPARKGSKVDFVVNKLE